MAKEGTPSEWKMKILPSVADFMPSLLVQPKPIIPFNPVVTLITTVITT